MKSQHDKSHKIKSILKPFRLKRKIVKKSIDNYQYYPYNHYHYSNHNPYSYHHVPYHPKHHSSSNEYINFKLSDLIRPNKSFIDNLYAQINSNSNKINLLYIPMVKNNSTVSDQVLYSNPYRRFNLVSLSSNDSNDSNTILNDFFLSASNLERVNKPFSNSHEGIRMPRLLTSEIFLICFVISLWLISILVCLKRYSLFICFHKRDVPFYNSSLINVSTKIATEEYTNVNNSRPLSPLSPSSHHHFYQSWNENEIHKERECSACSISPSTNAILNKSVTQATNFNTVLTHDQSICKKCYKHKSPSDYKSLSNDYFNFKSNSCSIGKIHKNFSFNSNHVHIQRSSKYDQNKFYYSNGIIYPIKQNSSTLLSKVSTSPKNSKPQLKSKDSLSSKRALIRKNHFNLMSLDENALYKLNRVSHMNSTIHESSIDAPEIEPKESKTDNKRLSVLTSHTNPHANFISLRSGSDSANSSWIKPGRSYDGDNCDCNELDSSISLHQSQFLRLPSLNKLNTPILPTSQRPINPISSLRRHMFVNSRRCAQTTFDRNQTDSLSQDIVNSLSIASNNLSNIPAIDEINNNNKNSVQNINNVETVEAVNECKDPNLLNPSWIPLIVRRTLLEMHERAVLSKSDSNIKSKYRSSNHLLHSIKGNSKLKSSRKKKSLSLQNSQDKSNFYSTSNNRSSNGGSSYLNNFYEELRQRFFLLNSNEAKGNNQEKNKENFSNCTEQNLDIDKSCSKNSTSNSNTISTDLSTVVFRLDSKLNSLDRQLSSTNVDKCLNEISGEENNAEFFDDKKK